MNESQPHRWVTFSRSVRGVTHERSGAPNQDFAASFVGEGGEPPVILAVSDGHGSARYFRSDVGARIAVETAVDLCRRFVEGVGRSQLALVGVKNSVEQRLPGQIVRTWTKEVQAHFADNPITAIELERLAPRGVADSSPQTAYGATLLVIVIGDNFVFYLQIGDGDILTIDSEGAVREPVPPDPTLIANETTSLCMERAQRYFRSSFQSYSKPSDMPVLILASTDGYRNSFADSDGFLRVAPDLLKMMRNRNEGSDFVDRSLPTWLSEASREGSGDDVSLGLIYRQEMSLQEVGFSATVHEGEIHTDAALEESTTLQDTEIADEHTAE